MGLFIAIGLFLLFFFSTLLTRQRGTDSGCGLCDSAGQSSNLVFLAPQSQSIDFELRVVLEKAHRALRSPFTQFTAAVLMMSPFLVSTG